MTLQVELEHNHLDPFNPVCLLDHSRSKKESVGKMSSYKKECFWNIVKIR